jgi:urocanate hydratase
MNSTVRNIDHHQSAKASPIEIFRERAEARAVLVSNGLMTLQDAVDGLQESAAAQGLLKYGQDAVQQIMAESFGRWRLANE